MTSLYIIGGQQLHARALAEQEAGWYKYAKGVILRIDAESGEVEERIEYVSPEEVCPAKEPAILFKCASLVGNHLFACTQTEVLVYQLPSFTLVKHISLPIFNDVHHVLPTPEGTLLVAISGLDLVVEVTLEGDVVREWNIGPVDTWERFSRECDYRLVCSTKPHFAHPNHLFRIGSEFWVTRFEQRDAICLTDPGKRIDIGIERVHDGLVSGDRIFFTTVNGHVVIANAGTLQVDSAHDLNQFENADVVLGWCRGVLLDGDRIWVGFSRLRLTKFRQNLSWVRQGFRAQLPTRVSCYDLAKKRLVRSLNVQQHGMDAVFSMFHAPASVEAQPHVDSGRPGVATRS